MSENPSVPLLETAVLRCPQCGQAYGAQVYVTPSKCTIELIDHPETVVDPTPPMARESDDWDDYEPPEDPFSIFNASLHEAGVLLNQMGGDGDSLVNRMVFAHFIGAFEAFLADTLINEVLSNPPALKRLIEKDPVLRNRRFSLSEIGSNPDLIPDAVRGRLRSEIWHNIPKASALYNISFEIDVLAMLGKNNPIIEKAVEYRHDCVHRNGHDKDGNKLDLFTIDYVRRIGDILDDVARDIVEKFNAITAANFFVAEAPSAE